MNPKHGKIVRALLIWGCLGLWVLAAGCLSQTSALELAYAPGVYEGRGNGYRGPILVRVQISHAGIEDIRIVSHRESTFPGTAAMEELIDLVLIEDSTELDAISGATFSSRGFLEALEEALRKASINF